MYFESNLLLKRYEDLDHRIWQSVSIAIRDSLINLVQRFNLDHIQ
jgi:hypothetical protein